MLPLDPSELHNQLGGPSQEHKTPVVMDMQAAVFGTPEVITSLSRSQISSLKSDFEGSHLGLQDVDPRVHVNKAELIGQPTD